MCECNQERAVRNVAESERAFEAESLILSQNCAASSAREPSDFASVRRGAAGVGAFFTRFAR